MVYVYFYDHIIVYAGALFLPRNQIPCYRGKEIGDLTWGLSQMSTLEKKFCIKSPGNGPPSQYWVGGALTSMLQPLISVSHAGIGYAVALHDSLGREISHASSCIITKSV